MEPVWVGALQGERRELSELPVLKNGSDNSKNNCDDFSAVYLGFSCSSFLRLFSPPLVCKFKKAINIRGTCVPGTGIGL